MGEMGIGGAGIKKGFIWKLYKETNPGYPQDYVGYYDNMGGRNGAEDGYVDRVLSDTYDIIILRKRERSREVRSYADVAR